MFSCGKCKEEIENIKKNDSANKVITKSAAGMMVCGFVGATVTAGLASYIGLGGDVNSEFAAYTMTLIAVSGYTTTLVGLGYSVRNLTLGFIAKFTTDQVNDDVEGQYIAPFSAVQNN